MDLYTQKKNIEADFKEFFLEKKFTDLSLQKFKNRIAKKYGEGTPRKNVEVLKIYRKLVEDKIIKKNYDFEEFIKTKKIRTQSGVSVLSVLTKPYPCPGECRFCPTEKGMPKSYLSNEPAVMRAIRVDFSAKNQILSRIKMLENAGHKTEKIEIIIMGGTFSFLEKKYKTNFIKDIFCALNGKDTDLEKAKTINQKAKHKCVGLTLETRPDFINEKELLDFRKLGCTRVELGIQSFDNKILENVKRGHSVEDSKKALKLLKDVGFKIVSHLMPGLPGYTVKNDIEMIKQNFLNPDFCADWLKIYPCVITKNCDLYEDAKSGKCKAISTKEIFEIIVEGKKFVPPWARINRVIRDIPSTSIEYGSKVTNLRQDILKKANCRCIRCREIRGDNYDVSDVEMKKREYNSSDGKELFLSFEDKKNDKILSLLRLRFPSQIFSNEKHFFSVLQDCSIIRELHTFGVEENIGKKNEIVQHKGFGKRLLQKAEIETKKFGLKKIAVIAGVGVREYYKKQGYFLEDEYMIKKL